MDRTLLLLASVSTALAFLAAGCAVAVSATSEPDASDVNSPNGDAFPAECDALPVGVESLDAAPLDGYWPSIDVASDGRIAMAWTSGGDIRAATWSGTAWTPLGDAIEADAQSTWFGAATIRSRGEHTIAAWPELVPLGSSRLVVARYNGSSWDMLGSPLGTVPANDEVALALDENGTPTIAWVELLTGGDDNARIEIAQWNGTTWASLGVQDANPTDGGGVMEPALIAGANRTLYLAWHERDAGDTKQIRVRYWDGTAWSPVGSGQLEAMSGRSDAVDPQLALDSSGRLHVAWSEGRPLAAHVQRWDGSSWQMLGSNLDAVAGRTSNARVGGIAVDASGRPAVVWAEPSGATSKTHVYRRDLTAFVPLAAIDPVDGAMGANDSDLAFDACGRAIVAWAESGPGATQRVHVRAIYQP